MNKKKGKYHIKQFSDEGKKEDCFCGFQGVKGPSQRRKLVQRWSLFFIFQDLRKKILRFSKIR